MEGMTEIITACIAKATIIMQSYISVDIHKASIFSYMSQGTLWVSLIKVMMGFKFVCNFRNVQQMTAYRLQVTLI